MKKLVKLLLLLLIAAINYNLIIKNIKVTIGGTQGIALLIYYCADIAPYISILIINMILFLFSVLLLSKRITQSIIVSSFVYPLFVKLTESLEALIFIKNHMILLIIAGILSGITTGGILKLGYSSGGVNVLVIIFKKYYQIPVYLSNFLINVLILLGGIIVFGLKNFLYSIIVLIINSFIIKMLNKNVNHCQTDKLFFG